MWFCCGSTHNKTSQCQRIQLTWQDPQNLDYLCNTLIWHSDLHGLMKFLIIFLKETKKWTTSNLGKCFCWTVHFPNSYKYLTPLRRKGDWKWEENFPKLTIFFIVLSIWSALHLHWKLTWILQKKTNLHSWINATQSTTLLCQHTQKGLIILRARTEAAETKLTSRKNWTLTIF